MIPSGTRRQRGAYFTPRWLGEEIAAWAIQSGSDTVLDPAAGAGDLLSAAAERVRILGGNPSRQVFGVEIHQRTWHRLSANLRGVVSKDNLLHKDFFDVVSRFEPVDVVVANPPYVRHHRISGDARERMRLSLNGLRDAVDGKASAWVYFLGAVPAVIRPGGRFAMVLPAELVSAGYAWSVLSAVSRMFATVRVVYCGSNVFQELDQQVVLCLAADHRPNGVDGTLEWASLPSGHADAKRGGLSRLTELRPITGSTSILRLLAPDEALAVAARLQAMPSIVPLGEVATVRIGYVTGANDFFQLDERTRTSIGLARRHVVEVVPRLDGISSLSLTDDDWSAIRASGRPCWLFDPGNVRDPAVKRLIARGRRKDIHRRSKCRQRHPWWKVLTGKPPAALMAYMGVEPRIIANVGAVLVSNSVFEIRDIQQLSPVELAAAARTSVFQLTALLNARVLSGGLRKLEPRDAAMTLIPLGKATARAIRRIDGLLRDGRRREARRAADDAVLGEALGWSPDQIDAVHRAFEACSLAMGGDAVR